MFNICTACEKYRYSANAKPVHEYTSTYKSHSTELILFTDRKILKAYSPYVQQIIQRRLNQCTLFIFNDM